MVTKEDSGNMSQYQARINYDEKKLKAKVNLNSCSIFMTLEELSRNPLGRFVDFVVDISNFHLDSSHLKMMLPVLRIQRIRRQSQEMDNVVMTFFLNTLSEEDLNEIECDMKISADRDFSMGQSFKLSPKSYVSGIEGSVDQAREVVIAMTNFKQLMKRTTVFLDVKIQIKKEGVLEKYFPFHTPGGSGRCVKCSNIKHCKCVD